MWLSRVVLRTFLFQLCAITFSLSLPDYCSVCGMMQIQPRIFKGRDANYGPWSVYMEYTYNRVLNYCTGTIIDFKHILTSAHCFSDILHLNQSEQANLVDVFAGDMIKAGHKAEKLGLEAVLIHPKFKYTYPDVNSYDDIAIMRLKQNLHISHNIRPACMGNVDTKANDNTLIQGYGHKDFTQNSNKLLEANMQVQSEENCRKIYGDMYTPKHLCAQNGSSGVGSGCPGDSGGGLFLTRKGRQYVVGITSFGGHCDGFPNQALVFSRISSYVPWIRKVTGNRFDCTARKRRIN